MQVVLNVTEAGHFWAQTSLQVERIPQLPPACQPSS